MVGKWTTLADLTLLFIFNKNNVKHNFIVVSLLSISKSENMLIIIFNKNNVKCISLPVINTYTAVKFTHHLIDQVW